MKKLLLILLTVMMGISSLTLSAQNTLTVAEGTATNAYVPISAAGSTLSTPSQPPWAISAGENTKKYSTMYRDVIVQKK